MPYGAIDIGAHALRLLIARVQPGGLRREVFLRRATRLGQSLQSSGRLSPEGRRQSLQALREFLHSMAAHGVEAFQAAGTSALREARDGKAFLAQVKELTGLHIRVLSPREEIALVGKALEHVFSLRDALVVDIGGGSTEWLLLEGARRKQWGSLPVGVVKLLHRPQGLREARQALKGIALKAPRLVLTGGAATALLALTRGGAEPFRAEPLCLVLTLRELRGLQRRLAPLGLEELKALPGVEPQRADLIMPGLELTIMVMETLGFSKALFSDVGVAEGLLIQLWESRGGASQ
jgi:exopolyphosphatase/guanosine-5'-triphosphate,3'-diphosphate pyrophosphatase